MRSFVLGLTLSFLAAAGAAAQAPQASIDTGKVSGAAVNGVHAFLGIPYAAPPVGALRWRAPQPVAAWPGVLQTTAYGHDCMQEPYPSDAAPLGTTPAEDCLVMNVWRPATAKAGDKLPVLVWIYGGGNVNGGASPAVYNGESFARNGVVLVSFNWRVGRFGFFGFPELTRLDADHGLLGNYGYMDAIEALHWVQRNVGAFGGDPKKVTIYGQSAGAGLTAMLLTSSLADGLFSQAIIQSGGSIERPPFKGTEGSISMEQAGVNFAERWGIQGTGAEALAKLRALTPQQVTDGIHIDTSASQAKTFVGPVRDGKIFPQMLLHAVATGHAPKVPLIIGSTTADNTRFVGRTLDEAFATFGTHAAEARAAYLANPSADPQFVLREMGRDRQYNEPLRFIATTMRAQGTPVYTYRFGYVANTMRQEWKEGPPHATDIPYAMNTVKAKYGDKLTATDAKVAETLHAYWVNFVRTGNPNGGGLPNWPLFDAKANELMLFQADGSAAAKPDPYKARLDALAAATPVR